MRNDSCRTTLASYDEKTHNVISGVNIECKNHETFIKIIEAVLPILEAEDIKKEED